MKIKSSKISPDRTTGFVVIEDLENAQQVCIDGQKLINVLKIVQQLVKLGFEDIIITVENDNPIVIGGKRMGIGIAQKVMEE